MKKIISSILVAFFVLLSPLSVYASTTEQSISLMSTLDSSSYDLYMRLGVYDINTDSISWRTTNLYNQPTSAGGNSGLSVSNLFSYSNNTYIALGLSFENISETYNTNWRIIGEQLRLALNPKPNGERTYWFSINTDNVVPFKMYGSQYWEGSGYLEDTSYHRGISTTKDITFSSFFSESYLTPSYVGNNVNTLYNFSTDTFIDFVLPEKTYYNTGQAVDTGNYIWTSGRCTEMDLIIVFKLNDNMFYRLNSSGENISFIGSIGDSFDFQFLAWYNANPNFYVVSTTGESSSQNNFNSGFANIQNSISKLSQNFSSDVGQIKTQITQSTNTITTKIDTMSQDIQTGLSNVVESAKQNTQNIINTVTQKVDEVKTGITEVKDSILDLPNKIQEMLLGLIVPDSETMADKYSEFSGLLEEKLGVIYQIPMMLFDFFDTIVNAATTPQTTLTLPAFQLPWIDGSTLTVWQPMEYRIIPEGMQVLSDLIKTITSMTVVVLTFNSVKRAYERFLRS